MVDGQPQLEDLLDVDAAAIVQDVLSDAGVTPAELRATRRVLGLLARSQADLHRDRAVHLALQAAGRERGGLDPATEDLRAILGAAWRLHGILDEPNGAADVPDEVQSDATRRRRVAYGSLP